MKHFKLTFHHERIRIQDIVKSFLIFVAGLLITLSATLYSKKMVKNTLTQDFELVCNEIKNKIDVRLKAHAQLLRSGAAYFAASDTVTRQEWQKFNFNEKININLPGILGVGYAVVIHKNNLNAHEQSIQQSGFPNYNVYPPGNRDIYTGIVYLEPFSGRNLRAFGYDMYSEPIRRQAMEIARDSNYAALSGKVLLVQETKEDIQAGTLMYVPVYHNSRPNNTIEQRRKAIKGWVYCPYRIDDLMTGVLGKRGMADKNLIHLKIYDDSICKESLLFDSQKKLQIPFIVKSNLHYTIPINFNQKIWQLAFEGYNKELSIFHGKVWIVLLSGLAISFLLFALSLTFFNTKERARQILSLNQQLEILVADKDRFISILGHDLRSPFNALLGFTELLINNLHEYKLEQIESHLKIIYESEQRVFNLLDNILMWTRSQAGKLKFNPQTLTLANICNDVIANMHLIAKNKNIELDYNVNNQIEVFADIDMVRTILRNLISNAIKFTFSNGQINISAEQGENNVTITIADNGIGMEPEKVARLFTVNSINSTKGTSNETGTGFGLLLCKDFVQQNGGKIWAESKPGQGSSFKFTLVKTSNTSSNLA
jgi:signal transduction histidine kinase